MRRQFVLPLLVAIVSAACAAAPTHPTPPPPGPVLVEAAPRADPADPCAEFNAREAQAARRHRGPGECPHCPCACVGGEIRCAPCARCDPARTLELPEPATPEKRD